MENFKEKFLTNYRWYFLFYLLVSFAVLFKLFIMPGSISGGDWGMPANFSQLKVSFTSLLSSWTHAGQLFGTRQLAPTSIIFFGPAYLLALLGVSISLTVKLFLLVIFAAAAANMRLFLGKIGLRPIPAMIAGLVFIFSPIFFDYALMGWIYVLFALALLPLFIYFFIQAVDQRNSRQAVLAGLIFALAMIQSQTLIWYPLTLFFVIIGYCRGKELFFLGLKYGFVTFTTFFLLNLYWLPSLLLMPDKAVTGSALVWGADSVGTSYRLYSSNIIKLWGSLFNYQFEDSYPNVLWPLAYITPLLGFSALFYWRKFRRHLGYLILLFLTLVLLFSVDRNTVAKLPFSNLIRDVARFTTLSTFSLVAMIGITLDNIFLWRGKKIYIAIIFLILFLNIIPFWTGKLFSGNTQDYDFRFRTKVWPSDYDQFDAKVSNDKEISRALYLPIGGKLSLTDDQKFSGAFNEIADVYPSFSSVPGVISISSRGQAVPSEIIYQLTEAVKNQDVGSLLSLMKITGSDLIVIRRDMQIYDWDTKQETDFESKLKALVASGKVEVYYDSGDIFAVKFLPQTNLIDSMSGPVEIKSNFQKILANFISDQIISVNDFYQIGNLINLNNLFGDKTALTFNYQDTSFSKYVSTNPRIYQFFSLKDLSEKIPMTIWWLNEQNKNKMLDNGLREENDKALTQLKKASFLESNAGRYLVYAENGGENMTVWFQSSSPGSSENFKINDSNYTLSASSNSLKKIGGIKLDNGVSIFQVESGLVPLFVQVDEELPKNQPPKITFDKLSETGFRITADNISDDFVLNFLDGFNYYWQLRNSGGLFSKPIVADDQHFVSDGYANGFSIKVSDLQKAGLIKIDSSGKKSAVFYLEFEPQKFETIGEVLSLAFLLVIPFIVSFRRRKK
ncbi:MAG: hypothetical protein NTW79_01230 [Candidatus Berkelbacteria bacterium]|nr:hypothetical protein [Candidatus Berkelbacteria bacterium]